MLEGAAESNCGLGHGKSPEQPKALLMPEVLSEAKAFSDVESFWSKQGIAGVGDVDKTEEQLRMSDGF